LILDYTIFLGLICTLCSIGGNLLAKTLHRKLRPEIYSYLIILSLIASMIILPISAYEDFIYEYKDDQFLFYFNNYCAIDS